MSTKLKLPKKLGQPTIKQSVKVHGAKVLDESKTVVSSGHSVTKLQPDSQNNVISINSDSSKEEDDSDVESMIENSAQDDDVVMRDSKSTTEAHLSENAELLAQPSFGDLVRANVSEPIDVTHSFHDDSPHANNHPTSNIQPPPGASLGAVLAQALRTNDISLLESCLHTSDVNIIRATIQRLESPLAAKLLQKLAERLHKRPGIARNLMIWVQWTLVAHGGYLASQRGLVQSLTELTKVIDERSKGLQSVLLLKGKLDMLEAQIELRRNIQDYRRRRDEEEDDNDSVIYVEGQEDEDSEKKRTSKNSVRIISDGNSDSSDLSDDIPTMNGIIAESEDEEDYSSYDENLIDDEAEDADSNMTDEEDDDQYDEESLGDKEDSDAAPPLKLAKARLHCYKK